MGGQRRASRQEVRLAVLDAAARVFAERGFAAASVEAICAAAGYSTGALYSNFTSKEELFLQLYEQRVERRQADLTDAVAAEEAGMPTVHAVGRRMAVRMAQDREWSLLYIEYVLHAARDGGFAGRLEPLRREALDGFARHIADGLSQAHAESALSPADLARVVRALNCGLALDRLLDQDEVRDALLEDALVTLLRGATQQP